jgi:hypothetical protein
MDCGAHLRLIDLGGNPYTVRHLGHHTQRAARLGFRAVAANEWALSVSAPPAVTVCAGLARGRALCRHRWARSLCRGHRRRQTPCSLGVTEGTRTPDLQGHNLGAVAGGSRSRPWDTGSDLRQIQVAADVDPGAPKATGEGVGAGMLPGTSPSGAGRPPSRWRPGSSSRRPRDGTGFGPSRSSGDSPARYRFQRRNRLGQPLVPIAMLRTAPPVHHFDSEIVMDEIAPDDE